MKTSKKPVRERRVSLLKVLRDDPDFLPETSISRHVSGFADISGEADLAQVAASLLDDATNLTEAERELLSGSIDVEQNFVSHLRAEIRQGKDPLGDCFCKLRSSATRRDVGATYTPASVVDAMVEVASEECPSPSRVIDPGCGSGRFLAAAASAFPTAALVGVEIDTLAALICRANAAANGFADRLTLHIDDFRSTNLPTIDGPTLWIGNPPYVRHHNISAEWKSWLATQAQGMKLIASKLAGLHVHFFLKTAALSKGGDHGIYITAAEWMDVNYGSLVRSLLIGELGVSALTYFSPNTRVFADALTTAAITQFRVGQKPQEIIVKSIDSPKALRDVSSGNRKTRVELAAAARWTPIFKGVTPFADGELEIGELFRVHRGQVTGANDIWIAGEQAKNLPPRFLVPTVTRAKELLASAGALEESDHLQRVVDLPVDLDSIDETERAAIATYLKWAKKAGAHLSYIATARRAWWSVGLKEAAPILCTYMARRSPAFVLNRCNARHLNIAHGLYPKEQLTDAQLSLVTEYLNANVGVDSGRTYAGGLTKFEPGEVKRLRIPSLERLAEMAMEAA